MACGCGCGCGCGTTKTEARPIKVHAEKPKGPKA